MSESLGIEDESKKETVPKDALAEIYDGESFTPVDQAEMNYLDKLQTNGEIDGVKWDPQNPNHLERLNYLREKKNKTNNAGPTQEQIERFKELRKLQDSSKKDLSPELRQELAGLYKLMDKKN